MHTTILLRESVSKTLLWKCRHSVAPNTKNNRAIHPISLHIVKIKVHYYNYFTKCICLWDTFIHTIYTYLYVGTKLYFIYLFNVFFFIFKRLTKYIGVQPENCIFYITLKVSATEKMEGKNRINERRKWFVPHDTHYFNIIWSTRSACM